MLLPPVHFNYSPVLVLQDYNMVFTNIFISVILVFTLMKQSIGDEKDALVVKSTIENLSLDLVERHLQTLSLPSGSVNLYAFSFQLQNGKFGVLSSMSVVSNWDQHLENISHENGTATYLYDVVINFDELQLSYDYLYTWLLVFGSRGSIKVDAVTNSVRMIGSIVKKGETCLAKVTNIFFTRLTDYEINLLPNNLHHTAISYSLQFMVNHILPSSILELYVNEHIRSALNNDAFKTEFSEILCKSFVLWNVFQCAACQCLLV